MDVDDTTGQCYLTFSPNLKGQLVPTHTSDQHEKKDILKVPGGGHVLIVPIAHGATLNLIPGELYYVPQSLLNVMGAFPSVRRMWFEVSSSHR
jgi:hypothetical protein